MENVQQTISPIDGSVYVERKLATDKEVSAVVESAKAAQKNWSSTPLEVRAEICRQMLVEFKSQEEAISKELAWMMGRPARYGKNEVAGMIERAEYMINAAPSALASLELGPKVGFKRYIKKIPVGVVLVVAPWNYPYLTAINSIIPAIMAGNSVILKHSAQTPLCAERLYNAFHAAGLPEGVFQFLHISHQSTAVLIKNPNINYVAFTGSVPGGEAVEKAASGRFIGVGLELGGKDPVYIREDADLDLAVEATVDGAFFNSGQSCCGTERIYVHKSIYETYLKKAVALTKNYILGRPDDPETTLGPMVKSGAADFVRQQIADAIARGAVPHIDESLFPDSQRGTAYLAPQILSRVDHSMRVMTEESFGPVVGVMAVENDDHAIGLMNDSEFGLTAAVFSQDIEKAIEIGEQVEAGTYFINRCDYLDPGLAWTGVKNSGRGCTLSVLGYDAFVRPMSFHIKVNAGD